MKAFFLSRLFRESFFAGERAELFQSGQGTIRRVFLVDSLYRDNQDMVEELNENYAMSIIPIPGIRGSTGIGISTIRESVERAVGMDIFSVK